MTPSNDDQPPGLAPLPYSFEASLDRALTDATGTQLALVLSEWMTLQVRHARCQMGPVAAALLDIADGSCLTPRVTSAQAADMLREAVATVRDREGLPADVAEALMVAAPHVLVGDDVAGAIARTALRLGRGDGSEWPEGSMLDAVRRDPGGDAWTVLFAYVATDGESGSRGSGGSRLPPYADDPYGFDRLGADEGYALPAERAHALRLEADRMAAVVAQQPDLTPIELLLEEHAYPYALVVIEGLLRGDEVSLVPGGSTVRHGPPPKLTPSEAAWLLSRGKGTEL